MALQDWQRIRELNRGGQGVVYLAIDERKVDVEGTILDAVRNGVSSVTAITTPDDGRQRARTLLQSIEAYIGRQSLENCGALKMLHEAAKGEAKTQARLLTETELFQRLNHPNLIRLLEFSATDAWYVMPY